MSVAASEKVHKSEGTRAELSLFGMVSSLAWPARVYLDLCVGRFYLDITG